MVKGEDEKQNVVRLKEKDSYFPDKSTLSFNLSSTKEFETRIAVFDNYDAQQEYVKAECASCVREYRGLMSCFPPQNRHVLRKALDEARWKFFKEWINSAVLGKMNNGCHC